MSKTDSGYVPSGLYSCAPGPVYKPPKNPDYTTARRDRQHSRLQWKITVKLKKTQMWKNDVLGCFT